MTRTASAWRVLVLLGALGLAGGAGASEGHHEEPEHGGMAAMKAQMAGKKPAGHHGSAHWGYTGAGGPAHWGDLKDEYILCKIGQNQSPIDIGPVVEARLEPITFDYGAEPLEVINNGHTIQVNRGGGTIMVDGQSFRLLQFHFHGPSEHTVGGKHHPLEMHLVHRSADGHLAVVGVFLKEGAENPALAAVWEHMPERAGGKARAETVRLDVDALLPKDRSYFRYSGSLTTPPCSEGVRWLVLRQPVEVSAEQIRRFREVMEANNRPVQPLHARKILTPF